MVLGVRNAKWVSMGWNQGRAALLQAPGDNPFPCLFHLLKIMVFFGSWPSSVFKTSDHSALFCPYISFSDFLPHSTIYKDPCDYIEPCQIILSNLLVSRSLIYSHLQNPFCLVRIHIHRFWGLQYTRCGGGALSCLPHVHKSRLSRWQAYIIWREALHLYLW